MKKSVLGALLVFSLMIAFFGCSPTFYTLTNKEANSTKTNEENITITTEKTSLKSFEEIGYISTTQSNIETAKLKLKKEASKMGGDAILNFKVTVIRDFIVIILIPVPVDHYICRGEVVKFI